MGCGSSDNISVPPMWHNLSLNRRPSCHRWCEVKEPQAIFLQCPSNFSLIGKLLLIDLRFIKPSSKAPIIAAVRTVKTHCSFAIWRHNDSHHWHISNVNYLQHNIISLKRSPGVEGPLAPLHGPAGGESDRPRGGDVALRPVVALVFESVHQWVWPLGSVMGFSFPHHFPWSK